MRSEDTPVLIGGSSAETISERRSGIREDKSVLAPSDPNDDLSKMRAAFHIFQSIAGLFEFENAVYHRF